MALSDEFSFQAIVKVDPIRSAAAKKAWITRRAREGARLGFDGTTAGRNQRSGQGSARSIPRATVVRARGAKQTPVVEGIRRQRKVRDLAESKRLKGRIANSWNTPSPKRKVRGQFKGNEMPKFKTDMDIERKLLTRKSKMEMSGRSRNRASAYLRRYGVYATGENGEDRRYAQGEATRIRDDQIAHAKGIAAAKRRRRVQGK